MASKTLTKADIIDVVREELRLKRCQSVEVVESLIEIIKKRLEGGENILISGFGKFFVREKSERKGRDPATGEDKILPARRVVTFKCSINLRKKLNGK